MNFPVGVPQTLIQVLRFKMPHLCVDVELNQGRGVDNEKTENLLQTPAQ